MSKEAGVRPESVRTGGISKATLLRTAGATGLASLAVLVGPPDGIPVVGDSLGVPNAAASTYAKRFPKRLNICVGRYEDPETGQPSGATLFPGARDFDGAFAWRKKPMLFRAVRVDKGAPDATYKIPVRGGSYVHLKSFGGTLKNIHRGLTRNACPPSNSPSGGVDPETGMPSPDQATGRSRVNRVVLDTNSDQVLVTPDGEFAYWPECVENKLTRFVGGTVVFAAGTQVLGWRANAAGYRLDTSLLGPHVKDTDAMHPADTTAQLVVRLPGAEISHASGSDLRVTISANTKLGPRNFSLRAGVDEVCQSSDGGSDIPPPEVDPVAEGEDATVPSGF